MTRLILVRHGETIWNLERRYQGQEDSPLSPLGKRQASKTGEYLAKEKIDALYSSDLKRALITAEEIGRHHQLTPTQDQRMREMSFGIWEGLTLQEIEKKHPQLLQARQEDILNTRIPRAELPHEVVERFQEALGELLAKHHQKTVAIISHGGCLRLNIAFLLHIPLEKSNRLRLANAGISELLFTSEKGIAPWRVAGLNFTGHL